MKDGELRDRTPGERAPSRPRRWGGALTAVAGGIAVVLGVIGFSGLPDGAGGTLGLGTSLYRTAQLFTLNLDVPDGVSPGPELWIAAVLAPLTTARVLFELLRGRLRGVVMQRVLRDHVVVCGAGARGAHLAEQYAADRRRVVLVDRDAQAPGMADDRLGAWVVVGDARSPGVLRRAGAHRAERVIAITGDDTANATIASAMRDLAGATVKVFVHVDDPGLARLVAGDRSTDGDRPRVTPFSSTALAAAASVEAAGGAAVVAPRQGEPASILICGDDAVVDALVLELHRGWQVQRLGKQPHALRPRITLLSNRASARVASLRRRYDPALADLEIIAHDVEPEIGATLDPEVARLLRSCGSIRQAWVVDRVEISGLRLAIALSRTLGRDVRISLLSEAPTGTLAERVIEETSASEVVADVVPESLVTMGAKRHQLEACELDRRLRDLGVRGRARRMAFVDDPAPIGRRWERDVMRTLEADIPNPEQLLQAGLRLDLLAPETAALVGPGLVDDDKVSDAMAFTYCARVAGAAEGKTLDALGAALEASRRPVAAHVQTLLQLRRKVGPESGRSGSATRHLMVAGGADTWDAARTARVRELLTEALDGPPWHGVLISGGTPQGVAGVVGDLAHLCEETRGYLPATDGRRPVPAHPGYSRKVPDGEGFSVAQPLRAWKDLIGDGVHPSEVRVLVFPGGSITRQELALAHALGAPIGLVDLDGRGEDLDFDELPGEGCAIIPLPADAMAIRAFVRDGEAAGQVPPEAIDRLARAAHERYRTMQRAYKAPDDPAMQPWERLSPIFRRSNEAQAAHIPSKLALLGLQLAPAGAGTPLDLQLEPDIDLKEPFADDRLEALARMEHGRWLVERARLGWERGERRPHRLTSPYLLAWDELDDDAKSWDRDVVAQLPGLLEEAGLRVEPLARGTREPGR